MGKLFKKSRALLATLILLCVALITSLSVSFAVYVSEIKENQANNNFNGNIQTYQYFDSGTGTQSDPYVITRPRHLYNLSRLISFGLISGSSYFQIGNSTGKVYGTDDGTSLTLTALDMSSYTESSNPFYPIGSETTPFSGTLGTAGDAYTVKISNLTVIGNQQDVGVFGYIASGAKISNLTFSNVNIKSYGYSSSDALYSDSVITDITSGITLKYGTADLASASALSLSSSNKITLNYGSASGQTIKAGTNDKYTISYVSGYNIVISDATDGSLDLNGVLSTTSIKSGESFTDPFYIVASYKDSNKNYISKVIKTIDTTFKNTGSAVTISASATRANEHGFNIGYIAGHCDGSMEKIYLLDDDNTDTSGSSITVNGTQTSWTNDKHNSRYGLVGLVSPNVVSNSLSEGETSAANNLLDFELKPDVNPLSASLSAGGSETLASYFTIHGAAKNVTKTVTSQSAGTTATSSQVYYDTANSKFVFPTSYANSDGTTSMTLRSGEFPFSLGVDHKAYQFEEISNRDEVQRTIEFTTQGKGLIFVLFAGKGGTSNPQLMMMKTEATKNVQFNNSGITSSTTTTSNGSYTDSSNNVFYLGRSSIGSNNVSINTSSNFGNVSFAYFEIPEAGNYYLGTSRIGTSGAGYIYYLRFIYASDNGNTGSSTAPSFLNDEVTGVDYTTTYNSTNYLAGLLFNFRESAATPLTFLVYFNQNNAVLLITSSSTTAESVKVSKFTSTVTGYTYVTTISIYANSTSNTAYTLTGSSNVTFNISSSTTTITASS